MSIDLISGINLTPSISKAATSAPQQDFLQVFNDAMSAIETTDQADQISNIEMLSGEGGTLHGTLLEAEKADIALRLTLEVRNKVMESYKEIMSMQV